MKDNNYPEKENPCLELNKEYNKKSGVVAPLLKALLQQWIANSFRKLIVPVQFGGRAIMMGQIVVYRVSPNQGVPVGSIPTCSTLVTFQTWKPRSPQRQRDFRNHSLCRLRQTNSIYPYLTSLSSKKLALVCIDLERQTYNEYVTKIFIFQIKKKAAPNCDCLTTANATPLATRWVRTQTAFYPL